MIKANNYPDRASNKEINSRRPPRIDYVEYDIDPESEIDSKARASLKRNLVVK